jgi:hypothetical protein
MGTGERGKGYFLRGIKRPGREGDQSPATIADVKNKLIYTSTQTASVV